MKVIFLISHIPPYDVWEANNHTPNYHWQTAQGEMVGFDGTGWGDQILEQIIKVVDDRISFEVWQPDLKADKVCFATLPSGLTHRLFPAKPFYSKLTAIGGKKEFYCPDMIVRGRDELKSGEKILFHAFMNNRYNTRLLLKIFCKKAPFLFQFATNSESHLIFGSNPSQTVKDRVLKIVLRQYFKRMKYLFTGSNRALGFPAGHTYFKHENLTNIGVDFKSLEISMSKEEAREKLKIRPEEFVLFSSQRLVPEKQIDKLLHAMNDIRELPFKLIISGSGNKAYQDELLTLTKKLDLADKVEFVGYISGEVLNLHYKASDMFVSTSVSETGPDSVYKAIAFNLPIALTDTGIAYEFIADKEVGIILGKHNHKGWSKQLEAGINDISKVKVAAEVDWKKFFNWTNVARYYASVYDRIVEEFYE